MKKKFRSLLLAVCAACLLAMTACSAAEMPAASAGAFLESVTLTSKAQSTALFSDVPADAGYAPAVVWCEENGILNGVGGGRFDPEGALTRAMLAAALYRADGQPAVTAAPDFADTQAGTWYSDAVSWANGKGILRGYGNGLFGTNDPVSVEQLEVIMGRYTGAGPDWKGDVSKARAATRAQVAVALYEVLKNRSEEPVNEADIPSPTEMAANKISVAFNGHTYTASLADNSSAKAFAELLKNGPLTISAHDYGNFEKVGPLGTSLPQNNTQITTSPGDIILYQGDQITVYYAQNTWSFTRLGRIDDPTGLREALGSGDVDITFALL